jgi:hypothetical protein
MGSLSAVKVAPEVTTSSRGQMPRDEFELERVTAAAVTRPSSNVVLAPKFDIARTFGERHRWGNTIKPRQMSHSLQGKASKPLSHW